MPEKQPYLDFIAEPVKKWMDFIRPNALSYYIGLLKIHLTSLAASVGLTIAFLILSVILILLFGGMGALTGPLEFMTFLIGSVPLILALLVFGVIYLILMAWINTTINLTAYRYTDSIIRGNPFGIIETFMDIKNRTLRYLIVAFIVELVIVLPVLVVTAFILIGSLASLASGESALGAFMIVIMGGMILVLLAVLLTFAMSLVFSVIAQFWVYGFLLEEHGVIDALKKSYGLLRSNFLETIGFDILYGIIGFFISIPLIVFSLFTDAVYEVMENVVEDLGAFLLVYLAFLAFDVVVTLLLSTLVQAFSLPTHYLFWRKINKIEV